MKTISTLKIDTITVLMTGDDALSISSWITAMNAVESPAPISAILLAKQLREILDRGSENLNDWTDESEIEPDYNPDEIVTIIQPLQT